MKTKFTQPAPDGSTFTPDAFDSQIGKEIPVNIEGQQQRRGRVVAAEVSPDGQSVELTLDIDVPGSFLSEPSVGSFGFSD